MKVARISSFVFAGSLLLSAAAFAGPTNKKSLHIYDNVIVEGKQLAPGDYKIAWSESGSDVQVSILRGKETVAVVPARVVPVTDTPVGDSYSVQSLPDGTKALTELVFSGKKYELEIQSAAAAGASQTSPANRQN